MYIIRILQSRIGWPCETWGNQCRLTFIHSESRKPSPSRLAYLTTCLAPTKAVCHALLSSRSCLPLPPGGPRQPSHQDAVLGLLRSPATSTRAPLRTGRCAPRHGTRRSMAVTPPAAPRAGPAAALRVCGRSLALALPRALARWPRLLLALELLLMLLLLPRCLQHGLRVQGRAHVPRAKHVAQTGINLTNSCGHLTLPHAARH